MRKEKQSEKWTFFFLTVACFWFSCFNAVENFIVVRFYHSCYVTYNCFLPFDKYFVIAIAKTDLICLKLYKHSSSVGFCVVGVGKAKPNNFPLVFLFLCSILIN